MFPQRLRVGWGKKAYMDDHGFIIEVTQQISKTTYEKIENKTTINYTLPSDLDIDSVRAVQSWKNPTKNLYYIVVKTNLNGLNGGRLLINSISNDIKKQISIFNKINK